MSHRLRRDALVCVMEATLSATWGPVQVFHLSNGDATTCMATAERDAATCSLAARGGEVQSAIAAALRVPAGTEAPRATPARAARLRAAVDAGLLEAPVAAGLACDGHVDDPTWLALRAVLMFSEPTSTFLDAWIVDFTGPSAGRGEVLTSYDPLAHRDERQPPLSELEGIAEALVADGWTLLSIDREYGDADRDECGSDDDDEDVVLHVEDVVCDDSLAVVRYWFARLERRADLPGYRVPRGQ